MLCAKCGHDNPDTLKFCGECGAPALIFCPSCKAGNPRQALDCHQCHQTLGGIDPLANGERRQLTLFFSDLVGSSGLSERMDPEELHQLYAQYQQSCADIVRRYDGYIAQYLGDGILAYFGYPNAHEDDAVRAVQSGIELLQRQDGLTPLRQRPQIRIGIHTGLVMVGGVGSGQRREQLALGEAPNIAARLQSEAAPDTLLISEATRRLVAGHFMLDELGSRTLKGVSRPLQIFRVLGRSNAVSRFDAQAASGLAPFIGRGQELALIASTWAQVAAGACRTLLVRGEAGIGKSRLLGMARDAARSQLHELFELECSPYDMNSALYPVTNMLRRRLGLEIVRPPEEMLEALERFVAGRGVPLEEALPLLAELFGIPTGERYPALDMAPARRRQRTLEILADLLLHAPEGTPVLMLVEDLHWADPSTLELVGALVARQAKSPLGIVCTTRPEPAVAWPASPNLVELNLPPLPLADARALIKGVVGPKPLPESVVQELIERTGGVPLFVEAVTRTILETGVLRELDDRYELHGQLPPGLIPDTVHDSLMARIDRLGADKSVAQLASVIGRQFGFELLQQVSGRSSAALKLVLGRLLQLDLIDTADTSAAPAYAFKHALIQDAAYESLLRATRQEIHRKIAETLIALFPETAAARPDLVAQHFSKAGLGAQALKYWQLAGQLALGRAANHEAIAHLKRALESIDSLPEAERLATELELQAALAPALTATQGWASPELDRAYRRAGELIDLLPGTPHRLPVLWGTWAYHFVAGRVGESLALAPQVLQLATQVGSPLLIPPARHASACSHTYHGDFVDGLAHANAGLAVFEFEQEKLIARNFGHASSVCLESFKGDALWMLGQPQQALQASDRSLALARRLGHMPSLAWAVSYKTWFHHLLRDAPRILEMADEAIRLSGEEGFAFWEPMVAVYRGWALTTLGQAQEGIASMRGGLARYRAAGNGCTQVHMMAALAEAHWLAGNEDEAMAVLREAMATAKTTEEGFYEPELYRLKGQFQLAQAARLPDAARGAGGEAGQLLAAAERSIRLAGEMARGQGARSLELRAQLTLCRLQQQRGDASVAAGPAMAELYRGFTEGLATPDLREAQAMLASLAPATPPP